MKYWAYVNNEILGPYEKEKLFELPVFGSSTLICPQTPIGEKTEDWKEAATYPEISALLNSSGAPAFKKTEPPVPPAAAMPVERSQPVFNSEEPQVKLKSLSPSSIEPAVPQRSVESADIGIEVSPLGRAGDVRKTEPPQDPAKIPGAGFDPLAISQIGRRADTAIPAGTPEAKAQAPDMFKPAEPVVAAVPNPAPAVNTAVKPATASAPQGPVDPKALSEITSRLENLARNSLSRQDLAGHLDPLKEKLSQLGEVLSSIKNSQFQREILDKLQYFESALSDIKASLALSQAAPPPQILSGQNPAAAVSAPPAAFGAQSAPAPQAAETERPAGTVFGVQPPPKIEPVKPAPEAPAKTEIVDQGSSAESSKIGGILKKALKAVIILILSAVVLGGAVFGLKHFGIFDITKFIPLPFLAAPKEESPAAQTFPPQPLEPQAQAPAPAEARQQPQKAVSPDEIIYFARTYSPEEGGKTLENGIFQDAARRKGNFVKAEWKTQELSGGSFEITVAIPLTRGKNRLVYRYEIDYARKAIKALDEQSKPPLDSLTGEKSPPQAAKQAPAPGKKGGKGKLAPAKTASKQVKPAVKPAHPKAAAPAEDEEYEYVEEDVSEASGEEE